MLKRLERIQRLSVVYERLKRDFDGNSLAASVNASNGDFERAKAQADVAIGLLQEYGELYRHYDTQRAAYVSALTAIAVTATAADFYAKLPQSVEILDQVIIYPLATILFSLGSVGFIATRKSRLRMKLFYARFSDLRKIVDKLFPELEIEKSVELSRVKVQKSGPLSRLYSIPTRGFAWDAIPIFLIVIGGALMSAHGIWEPIAVASVVLVVTLASDVVGHALRKAKKQI